ncbi:hypothetical protein, partial [Planktothrix agardhii]|uniref:hypothetical protein n=1 Tax=Planktothrix agardhii TaxID=1160 RepID=UPI003341A55A
SRKHGFEWESGVVKPPSTPNINRSRLIMDVVLIGLKYWDNHYHKKWSGFFISFPSLLQET